MARQIKKAKNIGKRIHNFAAWQLGIDLKKLTCSIFSAKRYFNDLRRAKKEFRSPVELAPCLHDWYEMAGSSQNEYFWQDLFCAQYVHRLNPTEIYDVGSRLDGYITHVASFRRINLIDIRPLKCSIHNITYQQGDICNRTFPANADLKERFDLVSCLHTLEHIGLGRYGDDIRSEAYLEALKGLKDILRPKGKLLLSTPIGRKRVEFNSHRVFDGLELVETLKCIGFRIDSLYKVRLESSPQQIDSEALVELNKQEYSLITFILTGS